MIILEHCERDYTGQPANRAIGRASVSNASRHDKSSKMSYRYAATDDAVVNRSVGTVGGHEAGDGKGGRGLESVDVAGVRCHLTYGPGCVCGEPLNFQTIK